MVSTGESGDLGLLAVADGALVPIEDSLESQKTADQGATLLCPGCDEKIQDSETITLKCKHTWHRECLSRRDVRHEKPYYGMSFFLVNTDMCPLCLRYCNNYAKSHRCRHGDACRYQHDVNLPRSEKPTRPLKWVRDATKALPAELDILRSANAELTRRYEKEAACFRAEIVRLRDDQRAAREEQSALCVMLRGHQEALDEALQENCELRAKLSAACAELEREQRACSNRRHYGSVPRQRGMVKLAATPAWAGTAEEEGLEVEACFGYLSTWEQDDSSSLHNYSDCRAVLPLTDAALKTQQASTNSWLFMSGSS
mmetsp:Transcript_145973/g.406655  ORF Transcript_145973/g.406655 Transcript_145973/m.406655 type:complete len:314 (+) Transcript_145973:61-1002(+)